MSRFADPTATRQVDLGPCECPGTPHETDWARIRAEVSGSQIAVIQSTPRNDELAASEAVAPLVVEWNLLGPDGEAWPPDGDAIRQLKSSTLTPIVDAISAVIAENTRLPNSSGAPSRASSRGSASRARTTTSKPGT